MFLFLDILKMLLQILFQNWLLVRMFRSFSHLFIGVLGALVGSLDINVYSFESGLFDLAMLLILSNSGGCSRCVLEIPNIWWRWSHGGLGWALVRQCYAPRDGVSNPHAGVT